MAASDGMIARIGARNLAAAAMLVVIGVALWFRWDQLTALPFWLDEGYSAYGAEKDFHFIGTVLPTYETHPPFYTALLRCWTLVFGTSIPAFRAFGALAGTAALAFIWLAAREGARVVDRNPQWAGLSALALASVLTPLVYWSRVVRPYSLIMLVAAIGLWAVLRIAREMKEEGRIPNGPWIAYLACQSLLFWLHNLGALNVAALGLVLLIMCGPMTLLARHTWRFIGGHMLILLAASPVFMIIADQAPTWAKSTWLAFIPEEVPVLSLNIFGMPGAVGAAFAAVVAAFAIRSNVKLGAALVTMALFPILVALVISVTVMPIFLPRTLIAVAVPFAVLLGIGAASGSRIGSIIYVLLLLLASKLSFEVKRAPPPEDWYGVVNWLKERAQPGDLIYAYPNETALPLHYALREKRMDIVVREIPGPVPSRDPTGWFPTGSRGVVSLPRYRLDQIASDPVSQAANRIWLVRLWPATYDRKDDAAAALQSRRAVIAAWPEREPAEQGRSIIEVTGFGPLTPKADRKE